MLCKTAAIAALMLAASAPALAVNRCTGPDGRVSFQDQPCAGQGGTIEVKPSTGKAPATGPSGLTEAQRINAAIDRSAAARRLIDLDSLLIPRASQALDQSRARCASQRTALERSQYAYKQNLYGKTHAAQIASEIVQLTLDCDREDKELTRTLRSLEHERQRMASAAAAPSGTAAQ